MVVAYYKQADSDGIISKRKYWVNRFARIYPVYFLALLGVAIYYWTIDRSLFTSFNLRLPIELVLLQSWIGKTSINFPGWSLSVELFFYISFPFLLYVLAKLSTKKLILGGFAVYAVSQIIYVFVLTHYGIDTRTELAINYFPPLNFATFVFGSIIGILEVRHYDTLIQYKVPVKIAGYILCLLFLGVFVYGTDFNRYHHNGLLAPVYALFIVAFLPPSKMTNWLGNEVFVFLGDISYSLYILQYPVWLFFRYFFNIEGSFTTPQFLSFLFSLILISGVVYKLYEQSMQRFIRTRLKN